MRKFRMLAALLCVAVFMCGFTMTAYAKAEDAPKVTENPDQWEGLDPVEETTEAAEPDAGFTEEGSFVTRDLLYDEHTNKQFITVQTSGGNTFYIIRNMGVYVRKMALNGYVLHVDLSPVRELVSLQRRCANNLNQVAIHANTYGVYPEEIAALQKDYAALWEPLFDLLEKLAEVVEM